MSTSTDPRPPELAVAECDVPKLLPFSARHFRRMRSAGLAPEGMKVGRKRIFLRSELEAWAQAGFCSAEELKRRMAGEGKG